MVEIVSLQYAVERLSLLLADVDAAGDLNRLEMSRALVQRVGAATARFSEEIAVATGPDSALVQQ
ncbi:hypothetical protein, partial [Xanthobacter aminoxidans]|uniref:hypothetical protein n=1 Tax=Xanthobacter aminoxidans TaxID=186280 RepID=UPI0037273786